MSAKPNPPKGYTTLEGISQLIGTSAANLKKLLVGKETKYNKKFRDFLVPILFKDFKPRSGSQVFNYYKIPTETQLEKVREFFGRTTISQGLIDTIKTLHDSKVVQSSLNKGTIPSVETLIDITGKSVGTTANALGTLGSAYRGKKYRGFELPKNAKKGKVIFDKIKSGRSMTNPLKRAWYNIAIDEVDKSIGQEVGTFKKFKNFFKENLNRYLGKGHGFSLNEITSIVGSERNKLAPYAAFVDITKSDINTKQLAGLQGEMSKVLERADKLIKKGDTKSIKAAYERIKKFNEKTRPKYISKIEEKFPGSSKQLRFPEIIPGTKLTDTYKASDLAKYKELGIDLQKLAGEKKYYLDVKGARPYPEIAKNLKRNLLNAANRLSQKDKLIVCSYLSNGGLPGDCAKAIDENPVKFSQIVSESPATSGPLQKLKTVATNILKSPGVRTFGIGAGIGTAVGLVKLFKNDDPTTYLSNEDQQKNMLVDMATQPVSIDTERPAILDYQLPALGATLAASTAAVAPSTIRASRTTKQFASRSQGIERKKPTGPVKTGLRVLGRGLGVAASPALLAPFAVGDIASQIAEGDTPEDIATNPFNYLYPAFAEQTPKLTRGLPSVVRKVARLGLSGPALRILSRAGIGGFAASAAIQGLGLLDD